MDICSLPVFMHTDRYYIPIERVSVAGDANSNPDRDRTILTEVFLSVSQSLQENWRDRTSIRLQLLPSQFFPIHYSTRLVLV
jgi:hypothetical protein